MDRRTYLGVVGGAFVSGCTTVIEEEQPQGRRPRRSTPDERDTAAIDSTGELVDALESATEGDEVEIATDATLDLTGHWELTVPAGVTVRGGRGERTPGALLKSPDGDQTPRHNSVKRKLVLEEGARLTGLRLVGHYHEYVNPETAHDGDYYAHRGGGGVTVKTDATVDNCELSGWPYAAVFARANARITNNAIHHNAWEGLGYGVAIPEGNHRPVIESNYFNYNRHSISGAGGPQVGFVARFNVVGEEWVGSQFDMHGTEGQAGVAGGKMVIERNTFRATRAVAAKTRNPRGSYPAIDIRGTPRVGAWIERNWFYHDDREGALRQPNGFENVHFSNNHYGRLEPTDRRIGAPDPR